MVEILKNTKNMTKDEWLKWRDKGIGGVMYQLYVD